MDPSLLMAVGLIVRNTKVAHEQAFWCACPQVDTVSPLSRRAIGGGVYNAMRQIYGQYWLPRVSGSHNARGGKFEG